MYYSERPGLHPFSLVQQLVTHRSKAKPQWPQLSSGVVTLTHQARQAVFLACQAWGIGIGDEVLFPAYNCGTELDPILRTGATVVPYRVDANARIDQDDIRRRSTSRTRLLYVTHYFGWPQPLTELATWTRAAGIHLLEDCALSLFSGACGSFGDAAVYSMPKSLPVPDGGALLMRGERVRLARPDERPRKRRIARQMLSLVKTHMLQLAGTRGNHASPRRRRHDGMAIRARRPDMPTSYYFDANTASWQISRITERLAIGADVDMVIKKRRQNFSALQESVAPAVIAKMLAANLPDTVCPLAFPLLVHDRASWVSSLHERGGNGGRVVGRLPPVIQLG
jgi:hypothetical protein